MSKLLIGAVVSVSVAASTLLPAFAADRIGIVAQLSPQSVESSSSWTTVTPGANESAPAATTELRGPVSSGEYKSTTADASSAQNEESTAGGATPKANKHKKAKKARKIADLKKQIKMPKIAKKNLPKKEQIAEEVTDEKQSNDNAVAANAPANESTESKVETTEKVAQVEAPKAKKKPLKFAHRVGKEKKIAAKPGAGTTAEGTATEATAESKPAGETPAADGKQVADATDAKDADKAQADSKPVKPVDSSISSKPSAKRGPSDRNAATCIAGFFIDSVVGTPIAMARHIKTEAIQATRDLTGDNDNPFLFGAASILGFPAGVISGTIEGPVYGVMNAYKNADEPFSKDAMGITDSK